MRFMIIVKATPESEASDKPDETVPGIPDGELMADMATFHEEMAQAGVLLDGAGLRPSSQGWRVRHTPGQGSVQIIDGPFAETKELIAGYTLIQVRSREEALQWSRRFPNPVGRGKGAEVEVRQLFELEDFTPGPAVERFKAIDMLGEPK